MRHRGPAALLFVEIGPVVILAGQDAQPIVILGLKNFVDAELVVGNRAKVLSTARHNLVADFAAGGHVPKENAAVKKVGGVALAQDVARAEVLHTPSDSAMAKQFLEGRERLQTEHII